MKKIINDKTLAIDERVVEIINKLHLQQYEVFIVGGFIRDALLNIVSDDYDLCTNASLESLKALFLDSEYIYHRSLKTTLKVNYKGISVEISSYRKELYSNNYQKLEYVETHDFCTDSLRRDFTLNALGYDGFGKIYDCVGGLADLNKRIIRTIGNPNIRFLEDPRRIWRALRLSSQRNFTIDDNTLAAIKAHYLKALTININQELRLIISGANFDYVYHQFKEIFLVLSNNKFKNVVLFDRAVLNIEINLLIYLYFILNLDFDNDIYLYLNFRQRNLDFIKTNENLINKLSKKLSDNALRSLYIKNKNQLNQILTIFKNFTYLNPDNLKRITNYKTSLLKLNELEISKVDFKLDIPEELVYKHLEKILVMVVNGEIANNREELLTYLNQKALR